MHKDNDLQRKKPNSFSIDTYKLTLFPLEKIRVLAVPGVGWEVWNRSAVTDLMNRNERLPGLGSIKPTLMPVDGGDRGADDLDAVSLVL